MTVGVVVDGSTGIERYPSRACIISIIIDRFYHEHVTVCDVVDVDEV